MAAGRPPGLTTHVLDLARGRPGAGMAYRLYRIAGEHRALLVQGRTNADGRTDCPLLEGNMFRAGLYELEFDAAAYFKAAGGPSGSIWTTIPIRFEISEQDGHYHVPLLIAPGGYSTYRGS
ncbi:MAG: hydroxyisourate hydrolase [Alphaproteobacteria bacterium]|nr:hydroxyisourate hydrolase [Alphaproteobacteria bacterium]